MAIDVAVAPAMRLDVDAVPLVLVRVAAEMALPVEVERLIAPIGGRTPIGATTTPSTEFDAPSDNPFGVARKLVATDARAISDAPTLNPAKSASASTVLMIE